MQVQDYEEEKDQEDEYGVLLQTRVGHNSSANRQPVIPLDYGT